MNKIDLKDILQENLADDNQDYLSILGDEKEMLNDHTDIPDTRQFYRYGTQFCSPVS